MYHCEDGPEPGRYAAPADETRLLPASLTAWLSGTLAGWVAAGGLAFAVHLLVGRIVTPAALTIGWRVLLYAADVLAAAAGGALAAMLAAVQDERPGGGLGQRIRRALAVAGPVGLLAAFNAALLETHWRHVSLALLADPYFLVMLLLTLSAGMDGALLYGLLAGRPGPLAPEWGLAAPLMSEAALYDNLLQRVGHDRGVAERLLELERRKTPNASRFLLIINAIERLERDRR